MDILDVSIPKNSNKPPPYGGRPKFVKLALGDSGEFLPHIFYEGTYIQIRLPLCSLLKLSNLAVDPCTFKPTAGPLGEIHAWGLYPVCGISRSVDPYDNDACSTQLRMMKWIPLTVLIA